MTFLTDSLSVRALFEFREGLELGDGLFREITGIDVKELMAFRRGKLKQKPVVSKQAEERIDRCKKALVLAIELCGDNERALDWLYADSPTFGGKSPIDLTSTSEGMEKVQGFIDTMRAAVASPKSSASSGSENIKKENPAGVPQPASDQKKEKGPSLAVPPAVPPTVAVQKKTVPAPPAEMARPSIAGSYTPSGMARSRAQVTAPDKAPDLRPPPLTNQVELKTPPLSENEKRSESAPVPAPEPAATQQEDQQPDSSSQPPAPPKPKRSAAAKTIPVTERSPSPKSKTKEFAPPPGVDPTKRIFRLKEPLLSLREKRPDLTLKEISDIMVKRGLIQFKVQSHASRLSKSYTWATWTEVVNLADIFDGDPYELGSVRNE